MPNNESDVATVWNFIVAHVQSNHEVELRPMQLESVIDVPTDRIRRIIASFCAAGLESPHKPYGGRKLLRIGRFHYRVVATFRQAIEEGEQ